MGVVTCCNAHLVPEQHSVLQGRYQNGSYLAGYTLKNLTFFTEKYLLYNYLTRKKKGFNSVSAVLYKNKTV